MDRDHASAPPSSGMPLLALTAAVIDTETTGLDVKSSRIVQLGGVRIVGGMIEEASRFEVLVNPGEAIPAAITAIHGIADGDVEKARRFAEALPDFAAFIGRNLVLGYSLDFDFAVLKREHERAGLPWTAPAALDLRPLIRFLDPPLPSHALETVAGWLGVETAGRHSAAGDALITARIFLALLPHLRERGIRTVAEAQRAARGVEPEGEQGAAVEALARIDSYPFRHRVRDIMRKPPVTVLPSRPLGEAVKTMIDARISSLFITPEGASKEWGIVTERDVLRALANDGAAALERRVGSVASYPLQTVPEGAFLYRALGRMARKGFRHLGVHDEEGAIVGALSARDLLRQRAGDAIALTDAIGEAATPKELAAIWPKLAGAARGLNEEGADPRNVAALIAEEIRALTKRAAIMAEREMEKAGKGKAPSAYAVMVLGSGGRGESLLALDQDNAIIMAEEGAGKDAWFAAMAARMNDILHEAGVPLCKGGVMARNAPWRMSDKAWRRHVSGWLDRSSPGDILNADIFFDLAPVHGEQALARALRRDAIEAASRQPGFLALLALEASRIENVQGWFGRFATDEQGRVDLKKGGLMPIFSSARAAALRHGLIEKSTPERLAALAGKPGIGAGATAALTEAHRILMSAILSQQLRDIERGIQPSSRVAIKELAEAELERLRWALSQVKRIADILGDPVG